MLTTFLLCIFALECAVITIWGLKKNERMIQFPFLVAMVFIGWVLPQLLGLRNSIDAPEGALNKVIIMSSLSLGALFMGYITNRKAAS